MAWPLLWPLLTGLLSLATTAGLWQHEQQTQEHRLRDNFDFALRQAATRVEQRMASYEQMLRGTRGLFEASNPVTREDFSAYVAVLLAGADFAGLRSLGYAPLISGDRVAAHVATQRTTGAPGYTVQPPGERAQMAPLTYIEPAKDPTLNVLGADALTDPQRQAAMLRARDSGGAVITEAVYPRQLQNGLPDAVFLMFMPVYAKGFAVETIADRRAHLRGWVAASFRVVDLMSSLYGESTPGLDVRVFDGTGISAKTLLYPPAAGPDPAHPPRFEAQEYVGYAGHSWTLQVRSRPEFEQRYSNDSARIILVAGLGLSGLLALLAWQLATARERAVAAARTMTRQLRDSAEQLRQSQKMEAIGTLAGGIAHDFNNILAAVLGNVSLAQDTLDPGHPAQQRLAQIRTASGRARSLVQQIVTFSRQQPQELVVQPLRPLLEETVTLLRSTLPALVELQTQFTDRPLFIGADATQFQQVLMNLCTNAWHAMQGSTGRIVIGLAATAPEAGPAAQAHVWVSDNGSGMDEATRQRAFEPFFTTKPVGQGTGLGLSVVHGIVASHGGRITVSSTPGQGSRFDLYFPLAAAEAPAPAEPAPAAPPSQGQGQGQHVLYVDDDPVMVLMVEGLLQRWGYRVTCITDPLDALRQLRADKHGFELVVTDFNMPELSGLDLAREIRRLHPGLPLIITSGHVSEGLRADVQRLGVRHVLQKEYTLEQLVGLVQQALAEAASG
jgi:signal transduction histidine kinase/ActR/RegA family two-component response regulator